MKVVAIVQARMGSTRLKGKSLMKIGNYSLLEIVIRTVKRNTFVTDVIIATSNLKEDDVIQDLCVDKGYTCYRGDAADVLSRFLNIAKNLDNGDVIVRVTADNPINNHKASEKLFKYHLEQNNDYTCVRGLSHTVYEYIRVEALLALRKAVGLTKTNREHVTSYFRERPQNFNTIQLEPSDLGVNTILDKLLTVDHKEDYERFLRINENINIDRIHDMERIYCYLSRNTLV